MTATSLPTRALRRLDTWPPLRRLDRIPFGRALVFGLLLGLLAGGAILVLPDAARLPVAAVVIALAGAIAWSGQPVGIWEVAEEAEPLLELVAIEGGSFLMGSPEDEVDRRDNERQHRVGLSPFRMGLTTVTRAQYREVMAIEEAPGPGEDEHPVSEVSWFDAVAFCNRLSEREDLPPCYEIEGDEVLWIGDVGGYRLPTEAEWEYACRAGSTRRWSFGDDEGELGEYAWFGDDAGGSSHPVGQLEPNAWGLYDMHGNVWEWCWDAYGDYAAESADDPRGADEASGALRVLRGGAVARGPWRLRSAFRLGLSPGLSDQYFGFRCVRRARRPWPPSPTLPSHPPGRGGRAGVEDGASLACPDAREPHGGRSGADPRDGRLPRHAPTLKDPGRAFRGWGGGAPLPGGCEGRVGEGSYRGGHDAHSESP